MSDLYSSPHDQIKEQLRLTIETIKERQESELINNPDYGLLASVHDDQRIFTLTGAPTPDDLDEIIKALAHPVRREIIRLLKDPQVEFPDQHHSTEHCVFAVHFDHPPATAVRKAAGPL